MTEIPRELENLVSKQLAIGTRIRNVDPACDFGHESGNNMGSRPSSLAPHPSWRESTVEGTLPPPRMAVRDSRIPQ